MANLNVTSLTDYKERATEIIEEGVLLNADFSRFDVQMGVEYTSLMNFLDVSPLLGADSCNKTAATTGSSLSEKTITTYKYSDDTEYCFKDLVKKGLTEEQVIEPISRATANGLNYKMNVALWQGDAFQDGWVTQIEAGSEVTVSGATFTESNIDEAVKATIAKIPTALRARIKGGEHVTMFCSYATLELYRNNRIANNYNFDKVNDFEGDDEIRLVGYKNMTIKAEVGLEGVDDKLILTWDKNLVISRDEVVDTTRQFWAIDETKEIATLKTKLNFGTQVKYCPEVVVYTAS